MSAGWEGVLSQLIRRSWPGIKGGRGLPGTNCIKPSGHFLCPLHSNQRWICPPTELSPAFICWDISSAFYCVSRTYYTARSPLEYK